MRKKILVGVVAYLAAVGAAATILQFAPSPAGTGKPSGSPDGVTTADEREEGGPSKDAEQGLGRSFAVDFTSDSTLAESGGKKTFIVVRVRGALHVLPARRGTGWERAVAGFGDDLDVELKVDDQNQGDSGKKETLVRHLQTPMHVTRDGDGRIQSFAFEREVNPFARGLLRQMFTSSQLVLRDGETWSADESDATGDYVAEYRRLEGGRIQKSKRSYKTVHTAGAPLNAEGRLTVEAMTTIGLGGSGDLDMLEAEERLDFVQRPTMPRASSRSTLKLVRARATRLPAKLRAARDEGDLDVVEVGAVEAGDPSLADRHLVAGASFADLLATLSGKNAGDRERAHVQARMSALFRLDASTLDGASAAVRAAKNADEAGPVLASMAGAQTPESADALAKLAEDTDVAAGVRAHAMVSLGDSAEPVALEALTNGMTDPDADVRTASTLALGSAAMVAKGSDPTRAADAVTDLLEKLASAKTPDERSLILQALGNAGDDRAFGAIHTALADESVVVRSSAASALRFLTAAGVDKLLDAVMKHDPDEPVRGAATNALRFRNAAPHLAALAWVLRNERVAPLRVQALQVVGIAARDVPEARPLLVYAAENDPNAEARATAKAMLNVLGA